MDVEGDDIETQMSDDNEKVGVYGMMVVLNWGVISSGAQKQPARRAHNEIIPHMRRMISPRPSDLGSHHTTRQ